jgi:hypothetical protein
MRRSTLVTLESTGEDILILRLLVTGRRRVRRNARVASVPSRLSPDELRREVGARIVQLTGNHLMRELIGIHVTT